MATERSAVEARGVTKIFGHGPDAVRALDDVSIQIRENEFFTLLGPSGCGKTTLLRLIAGFELPTAGEILLEGEPVGHLPPNKRLVNTVFQSYALFPHMTVRQNIAFGLEMRGIDRATINPTVDEMLGLVQLAGYGNRRPSQLSGGQQQRVALARALANRPKVLLLDEPLSALDLKLRQGMRVELKNIQQQTGITFIFVTHDQEEALTMSDRLAVMSQGRIQQLGGPHEIYEQPVNRFVADFIGDTNFVLARVTAVENGRARCRSDSGLEFDVVAIADVAPGREVTFALRPEKIRLAKTDTPSRAKVVQATYVGTDTNYVVELADTSRLEVRVQNALDGHARFQVGDHVSIEVPAGAARMLMD
ncbi:MAG: ABC transporter ATP-binding protein [Rhodospirillaceae bacterium]|nr:ABC transporter ATP-binding protein [Rhodospirillaceae bacterium]